MANVIAPVDRVRYDELVTMTKRMEELAKFDEPTMMLATHALRVARDQERPTVHGGKQTARLYLPCGTGCNRKGSWGATGIVPPGHVLFHSNDGLRFYLAHDPWWYQEHMPACRYAGKTFVSTGVGMDDCCCGAS